MILTTTDSIPGKEFEIIGPVLASHSIMNIVVGNAEEKMAIYMNKINAKLEKAVANAGGDAAVGLQYWSVKGGDFFVTGTAVKLK